MPEIITRKDGKGLAYPYAYNDQQELVSVETAVKLINGQKEKYWLFPDKSIELILAEGEINQKHFRTKPESYLMHEGKPIYSGQIAESREHILAKQKIAFDGFFNWHGAKVLIKNARIESRIAGSRYFADCKAELLCGTPCIIEIIKTSETSESKKVFLEESKILTFEIYIDGKGNTLNNRFGIYGNGQIKRIQNQISKIERRYIIDASEPKRLRSKIREQEEHYRKALEQLEDRAEKEKGFGAGGFPTMGNGTKAVVSRAKWEVGKAFEDTKRLREKYRELKSIDDQRNNERMEEEAARAEIKRLEMENTRLENTFIQATKRCDLAWFRPARIKPFPGENRIHEFLYWCS